jgi:NodT family efflux transporter outer membrane factor (OMF) lipoprotein
MLSKQVLVLFIVTMCILSGCMKVGPNFSRPYTQTYCHWLEQDGEHVEDCSECYCDWWKVFNDPTLNELIEYAVAQNLTLRGAGMRILEARAVLGIAVGEWFPQTQNAVGSAQRVRLSANSPNSVGADLKYQDYQMGGAAIWELDFWGKFRRAIDSASEEYCASIANYQDVLVLLLGEVASTYVQLRTIDERIEIVKNNVKIQERSLQIVDVRFRAGMVTELDYQQAKAFLTDTQARMPALIVEQRRAKNALAVLLGMTPNYIEAMLPEPGLIPVAPRTICAGIPGEMMGRRPDVRRAYHQTAAQCARIGVAMADLYPHISIAGFVGLESSGSTRSTASGGGGKFWSSNSFNYFFGPEFSWSIWNYGRIGNNIRAQYSLFHEAIANYQNAVLIAYQEVENGLVEFSESHEQVEYLQESADASQRSVDLSNTQYVEGIADYTRVLNSEQVLLQAQERLATARGNISQGLINTYKALGGGWECCIEACSSPCANSIDPTLDAW